MVEALAISAASYCGTSFATCGYVVSANGVCMGLGVVHSNMEGANRHCFARETWMSIPDSMGGLCQKLARQHRGGNIEACGQTVMMGYYKALGAGRWRTTTYYEVVCARQWHTPKWWVPGDSVLRSGLCQAMAYYEVVVCQAIAPCEVARWIRKLQ